MLHPSGASLLRGEWIYSSCSTGVPVVARIISMCGPCCSSLGEAVLILLPPVSDAPLASQSSDGADYLGGASESAGCRSTQNPRLNEPSPWLTSSSPHHRLLFSGRRVLRGCSACYSGCLAVHRCFFCFTPTSIINWPWLSTEIDTNWPVRDLFDSMLQHVDDT